MHGLTPLFPSDPLPQLQLPCGHEYCKSCVEELRQKGVDRSCPLCRKPLPPGPDKLFDLGHGMYMKIKGAIDRSRPGVDVRTPWPALSGEQQREMDEARAMLREAADQGLMEAQCFCGVMYDFGDGVTKDDRLALMYYEKAARQGHCISQFNTGVFYRDGRGCEQSYERAAHWYEKAAQQDHAAATWHAERQLRHTLLQRGHPAAAQAATRGSLENSKCLRLWGLSPSPPTGIGPTRTPPTKPSRTKRA